MTLLLFFIILVLLCLILFLLIQKRTPAGEKQPCDPPPPVKQPGSLREPVEFSDRPKYDPTEDALLMLQPGYKLQDVINYFGKINDLKGVEVVPYCQSCDVMLFSIKGLNQILIKKIIHGTTEVIPPSPPHKDPPAVANGELGPVIYGFNYKVQPPVPSPGSDGDPYLVQHTIRESMSENPVLVAVLDTGLRIAVAEKFKSAPVSHCMGKMGYSGYNVIAGTNDTQDNFIPSGHGTPVTGMVLRAAADKVNVKILPVKVLDENGQGTLLQVMCGIAFAKNAGARVINLSLGFYAQDPGQAYFFKTFIDRMTTDNTLLIAAAGNAEELEDKEATKQIGEQNIRNLDKHLFYPAAYSADNHNIITVTTVQRKQPDIKRTETTPPHEVLAVVDTQNYSATKVQVGVESDMDNYFVNPFGREGNGLPTWVGSSFAAPKLAGIIAATYYDYLDEKEGWYDRDEYLEWLVVKGFLRLKQEVEATSLHVDKQVPHYLLMRSQKEYFISV